MSQAGKEHIELDRNMNLPAKLFEKCWRVLSNGICLSELVGVAEHCSDIKKSTCQHPSQIFNAE